MKIILVDDDKAMILILKRFLSKIPGVEIVNMFNDSRAVLEFIKDNHIDMIFLDISMPGENGLELAKKISCTSPSIDIVFTTSHREYAVDAFEIYAFDYLVKPISKDRVERTIRRGFEKREPLVEKEIRKDNNISVYLFGGIDVSSKSLGAVKWISAKSMELFTYLLLKEGRNISKHMIIEDIFPGMPLKNAENYLKTAVYQIRKTLELHDSNSLLISNGGSYKLEGSNFYVDFIDFEERIKKLKEINSSNVEEALEAEKIFIGDLLGDRAYYWSLTEREKYFNYYLDLAIKLGKYLFDKGDLSQASSILKKLIKFEPLNQDANSLFIKIFAEQKDKKGLIKHYEGYVKMIKKEIGIYNEPNMANLYEKLIEGFED